MFPNLRHLASLSGAVLSVIVLACGPSSGSGGIAGTPVPADQIGKAFYEKLCPAIKDCCNQNGFADVWSTCQQGAAAFQADFDERRKKHPDYTYDAQKAGNCIAYYASAFSSCYPSKSNFDDDNPDCEGVFIGSKAAGATCTSSNDCAQGTGGATCAGRGTSEEGVCVPLKAPAEGDRCLATSTEKPDPSATYAACSLVKGMYCDPVSKTCKKQGGVGTVCATAGNFNGAACDDTSYCNSSSKKCEPRAAAGESCNDGSGAVCAKGLYCNGTAGAAGKCVAEKKGGEACSTSDMSQDPCETRCDSKTGKCLPNEIGSKTCGGDFD